MDKIKKMNLKILLGLWLVLDGFLSMILVVDKYWLWQIVRLFRIMIGITIILI